MLDDDAYLRWLDQYGFSDSTRILLTDIRRSPHLHHRDKEKTNVRAAPSGN